MTAVVASIDVGAGVRVLRFADNRWAVRHECRRLFRKPATRTEGLSADRVHVLPNGEVTIRPAIECPRCNLRGYVSGSKWDPIR